MNAWKYTAAERRTIDAAYAAIEYLTDFMGHGASSGLRDAMRYERRQRSCITTAKALLVAGFARGRKSNPRAADLAHVSAGIITATIIGADSRRYDRPADVLAKLPRMMAAAAEAHSAYMTRGAAAARREIAAAAASLA